MSKSLDLTGSTQATTATVVCARCGGAIEAGLSKCPTCGAPQPGLTGAGTGVGLRLLGHLLGLLGLALVVVWVWPGVLRNLGLGSLARWLETSGAHRILLLLPIWMLSLVGFGLQRARSRGTTRAAWEPVARASAGQLKEVPASFKPGAWEGGPEVESRVRQWLLTLDTCREQSSPYTRLRAKVTPRRDFGFALMPQSRVLRAMTSPAVGGFLLKLGGAAATGGGQADELRRHQLEQVAFMVGEPVELGNPDFDHAFLLKSSDHDAALALFGELRGELLGLRKPGEFWQLTLTGSVADGSGLLEFREGGVVRDATRIEAIQQTMAGILEHLASDGFIAANGPSSKS